jgi:predicted nucleotidyltransferase
MGDNELRYGIRTGVWNQLLPILRSLPAVEQVVLFGSRAKGNFKPGSDIDLCVKGDALTDQDLKHLQQRIEELDLPWVVDLLHYESISDPSVTSHIDRVGVAL